MQYFKNHLRITSHFRFSKHVQVPEGATQILVLYTCLTREMQKKVVVVVFFLIFKKFFLDLMKSEVKWCLFSRKGVLFKFYWGVFRGHISNSCIPQNMLPKKNLVWGKIQVQTLWNSCLGCFSSKGQISARVWNLWSRIRTTLVFEWSPGPSHMLKICKSVLNKTLIILVPRSCAAITWKTSMLPQHLRALDLHMLSGLSLQQQSIP